MKCVQYSPKSCHFCDGFKTLDFYTNSTELGSVCMHTCTCVHVSVVINKPFVDSLSIKHNFSQNPTYQQGCSVVD